METIKFLIRAGQMERYWTGIAYTYTPNRAKLFKTRSDALAEMPMARSFAPHFSESLVVSPVTVY